MQRQCPDPQAGRSLHRAANSFHALEVSRAARQASSARPTPASVHNDGRMDSAAAVAALVGDAMRQDK